MSYKRLLNQVLEEKLVLDDDMIVSHATEFIENDKANASKQYCELTSFKRLAENLKKEYPRLPVCLLADSLYVNETVFEISHKENVRRITGNLRKQKLEAKDLMF